MTIIAYLFDGQIHCIACTQRRYPPIRQWYSDVNKIPVDSKDNEGDLIASVGEHEEAPGATCDTCGELLNNTQPK